MTETELRRTLHERHINMIAFNLILGFGLFLGMGRVLYYAGPGCTIIIYILIGTYLWSVTASLGEMAALFPVMGPAYEFARRFVDDSIGMAIAWLSWFSWIAILAAELLAIAQMFKFKVDEEYLRQQNYPYPSIDHPSVEWTTTWDKYSAIWVGLFLVVILGLNMLPARAFGEAAYVSGWLKLVFVIVLILMNVVFASLHRGHDTGTWTYDKPYSFGPQAMVFRVDDDGNSILPPLTGPAGRLAAFWTGLTVTVFSVVGFEAVVLVSPENQHFLEEETIKITSRKISLRVILLYTFAALAVGLNVPTDDPQLGQLVLHGLNGGQSSVFVLAAIRAQVPVLPGFINGFYVFSACATGATALFCASRMLHAIASNQEAWPGDWATESVRTRLERTWYGVPLWSVFVSWLVGAIAILSTPDPASSASLSRMVAACVVSYLIVYAVDCLAFLRFHQTVNAANESQENVNRLKLGAPNITPEHFNRELATYPYESKLQLLRAAYGFVFSILLIFFNGWQTLVAPVAVADFIASYISIVVFIIISLVYFLSSRGLNPAGWSVKAIRLKDLGYLGPVMMSEQLNDCTWCGLQHRRSKPWTNWSTATKKQKTLIALEWLGIGFK